MACHSHDIVATGACHRGHGYATAPGRVFNDGIKRAAVLTRGSKYISKNYSNCHSIVYERAMITMAARAGCNWQDQALELRLWGARWRRACVIA